MLPGRLTTEHIKKAIARGDGYIEYRGRVFSIAELKELDEVGRWNRRPQKESSSSEESDSGTDQERIGVLGERGNKTRSGKTRSGQELTEVGNEGAPE